MKDICGITCYLADATYHRSVGLVDYAVDLQHYIICRVYVASNGTRLNDCELYSD
jgi:hypothetical protein